MSILDTFYILFDSDAKKLDAGLKHSEQAAGATAEKVAATDKAATKLGATFGKIMMEGAAFLGLGLGLAAVAKSVSSLAAENVALEKLAAQLNTTADAVDDFQDAAKLLDISNETSEESLRSFNRAVEDSALGLGRAKKVFDDLGISVVDANGKTRSTLAVMDDLSSKLKDMDRGRQVRIMDRLGLDVSMLKLFTADMGALQARMARVDAASGYSLDKAIKRSDEYTRASRGMWLEINTLTALLGKFKDAWAVDAMELFTKGMKYATEVLKGFTNFILDHGKLAEGVLVGIAGAITAFLIPAALRGAVAFAVMLWPFVLVGAAITLVIGLFAALYDDVNNFLDGNNSVIGELSKKWPVVGETVRAVAAEFAYLGDVAKAVSGLLVDLINEPEAAWGNFLQAMSAGVDKLGAKYPQLADAIRAMGATLTAAGDAVLWTWQKVLDLFGLIADGWRGLLNLNRTVDKWLVDKIPSMAPGATMGQGQLAIAGASPIASMSSGAILAGGNRSKSVTVQTGPIEVHTQATDAEGIASAFGGALNSQLRQTAQHFDDGVDY